MRATLLVSIVTLLCSCASGAAQPAAAPAPAPAPPSAAAAPAKSAAPSEAPAPAPAAGEAAKSAGHQCNLLLGIGVTKEWFTAGFEPAAGDERWEAILRGHTFVQHWADPAHEAWKEPLVSPCKAQADAPDRVVFVAANFEFKTKDEWVKALTDVVGTIRAKYPNVKAIDLMTMVRGPGGASCGDPKSVVLPVIDEAVDQVSKSFPGLVTATPRFEMKSCDVFTKGGPHFTPEGGAAAAKMIADYYTRERP